MWLFLLLAFQTAIPVEPPAALMPPQLQYRDDPAGMLQCLNRHEGSKAASARLRCRVRSDGRLVGCEPMETAAIRRRDLETLRCIAETHRVLSTNGTDISGTEVSSTFSFDNGS